MVTVIRADGAAGAGRANERGASKVLRIARKNVEGDRLVLIYANERAVRAHDVEAVAFRGVLPPAAKAKLAALIAPVTGLAFSKPSPKVIIIPSARK